MGHKSAVPEQHIQARMYTIREASAYTRISRAFLYKLMQEGKLKFKKAGRRTLIEVAELDRYLNELPRLEIA